MDTDPIVPAKRGRGRPRKLVSPVDPPSNIKSKKRTHSKATDTPTSNKDVSSKKAKNDMTLEDSTSDPNPNSAKRSAHASSQPRSKVGRFVPASTAAKKVDVKKDVETEEEDVSTKKTSNTKAAAVKGRATLSPRKSGRKKNALAQEDVDDSVSRPAQQKSQQKKDAPAQKDVDENANHLAIHKSHQKKDVPAQEDVDENANHFAIHKSHQKKDVPAQEDVDENANHFAIHKSHQKKDVPAQEDVDENASRFAIHKSGQQKNALTQEDDSVNTGAKTQHSGLGASLPNQERPDFGRAGLQSSTSEQVQVFRAPILPSPLMNKPHSSTSTLPQPKPTPAAWGRLSPPVGFNSDFLFHRGNSARLMSNPQQVVSPSKISPQAMSAKDETPTSSKTLEAKASSPPVQQANPTPKLPEPTNRSHSASMSGQAEFASPLSNNQASAMGPTATSNAGLASSLSTSQGPSGQFDHEQIQTSSVDHTASNSSSPANQAPLFVVPGSGQTPASVPGFGDSASSSSFNKQAPSTNPTMADYAGLASSSAGTHAPSAGLVRNQFQHQRASYTELGSPSLSFNQPLSTDYNQSIPQMTGLAGSTYFPPIDQALQFRSDPNFSTVDSTGFASSFPMNQAPTIGYAGSAYSLTNQAPQFGGFEYSQSSIPTASYPGSAAPFSNQAAPIGSYRNQTHPSIAGFAGFGTPSPSMNQSLSIGPDRNQVTTPHPNPELQRNFAELANMSPPIPGPFLNLPENNQIYIGNTGCTVEDITEFIRCFLRLKMNSESTPENPAFDPASGIMEYTLEHLVQLKRKWQCARMLYGEEFELSDCTTRGRNVGTAIFTRALETDYSSLLQGIALHWDRDAKYAAAELNTACDDINECEQWEEWKWASWIGIMAMDQRFYEEIRDTIIRLTRAERARLDNLAAQAGMAPAYDPTSAVALNRASAYNPAWFSAPDPASRPAPASASVSAPASGQVFEDRRLSMWDFDEGERAFGM